ncbi:cytochrome c [Pedobacter sp. Hv1]|uniref:c-type cytochrome n=1 Tax=Pedobacter sp. Hv1 TaxID=1740090 RepID=UPI0006D893FF|nr:cytochrome c [Pedobacter sp. Hv1]KQC01147.1 copper oxidase [Pedobacter sp. Hv1]
MRKIILFALFSITVCCIIYSCQSAGEIEQAKYLTSGKDIYIKNCQNCHGANGEGLGELAPPLTDTIFLKANKSQLACIIKNGSSKGVTIHGKKYEGKMPAFEKMADIDVAQVIVYITNSFGNKQGMYKYEQVPFDLEKCK